MPKRTEPLTPQEVRSLRPGRHADGDGLYLLIRAAARAEEGEDNREGNPERAPNPAWWLYRGTILGKLHDIGLGRARGKNAISLAEARRRAADLRARIRAGSNPIEEKRRAKAAAAAARAATTFKEAAELYLATRERAWKNEKHRWQWRQTLEWAYAGFGTRAVAEITTGDVTAVLAPIWHEKPETASRLRGRIEAVLAYATANGWRSGENPARWRGHLDKVLLPREEVRRVKHHPALPWREIGSFMAALAEEKGVSALALRLAILAGARSGEVRCSRWSEIDFAAKLWTVPAERMKAGREHRVPLSAAAIDVLRKAEALREDKSADALVFPGAKPRAPLSDASLIAVLRRMGRGDLTAHGFRSTFRDWCAERTNFPRELAEKALAHTLESKVEEAYQRGDLLEKRRRMMQAWAEFCSRPVPAAGTADNVRSLVRSARAA